MGRRRGKAASLFFISFCPRYAPAKHLTDSEKGVYYNYFCNEEEPMENYFALRLREDDIRAISSIGLAHLGDAVYELLVRAYLCAQGKATGRGLHRAAV